MIDTEVGNCCPVVDSVNSSAHTQRASGKFGSAPRCGWYVPTKKGYSGRQRARWVLGVENGHVLYSKGGELHYECKVSTFEKWSKRVAAEFNPRKVASNKPATEQLEIA
jgi:hypothetical protein